MKHLFTLSLLLLVAVSTIFAASQVATSGRVVTESGEAIPFSTVLLLQGEEQVAGLVTDAEGRFTLTAPAGLYMLQVHYLGYEPLVREITLPADAELGDLTLTESSTEIEEVVVKAQLIRREADRFVVDVANSPVAVGKDGVDLLKTAPGVWVQEDAISVNGNSGTKVYVNDRELKLDGDQLMTYLRNLHAEDIQKIEVVPQSGADFDADSSAGIILITLKRQRNDGLLGSLSYTYRGGEYTSYHNPYLNLNYNRGGFNLYGSGWVNVGDNLSESREQTTFLLRDMHLESASRQEEDFLHWGGKLGALYEFNSRHSVGAEFEYWHNGSDESTPSTTLVQEAGVRTDNASLYLQENRRDNYTVTLNYIYRIDTLGSHLKFLTDYTYRAIDDANDNSTCKQSLGLVTDSLYRERSRSRYGIYTATLALEQVLSPTWRLKAGAKYTRNNTRNEAEYRYRKAEEWLPSVVDDYAINYTENIGALYLIASGRVGRFSLTAGLRGEYTYTTGKADDLSQDYLSLFPNAHLAWQLDKQACHSLVASYSRSIRRPSFWNLTPARMAISDYSYQTGNPELKPAFNNQYSLTLTMWHRYSLSLNVTNHTDAIQQVMEPDPRDPDILMLTSRNLPDDNSYNASLSVPVQLTKWWQWNTNAGATRLAQRLTPESPVTYSNFASWYTAMTFMLPAKFIIELSYYGNTNLQVSNISIGKQHIFGASVKKRLFNERLTLTLAGNNLFNYTQDISAIQPEFQRSYSIRQPWGSRVISFSASYNFNAGKSFQKRSVESGSAEEKSRM